jgi:hypothetical protein
MPPEVFVLSLLHGGREHELHVFVGHGEYSLER